MLDFHKHYFQLSFHFSCHCVLSFFVICCQLSFGVSCRVRVSECSFIGSEFQSLLSFGGASSSSSSVRLKDLVSSASTTKKQPLPKLLGLSDLQSLLAVEASRDRTVTNLIEMDSKSRVLHTTASLEVSYIS